MGTKELALQELITLLEDYHDYNSSTVEVHPEAPTALQFCKQVNKGQPCVYPASDLFENYKASRWTKDDLIDSVTQKVEVAVTPNGRADSLCCISGQTEKVFLQPASVDITLRELFEKLDATPHKDGPVFYLQSQNGNLTTTPLAPLFDDLPKNFAFAEGVISEPEAVNIWIGDEKSVTSAHRDPYENLYVVLRGSKTFTLWSPVDEVTLDARLFRTGRFTFDTATSTFSTILETNDDPEAGKVSKIPWVTVDPLLPRGQLDRIHSLYRHARPQTVRVEAGQMLYLPSGWYHHVAQQCGTWDDGTKAPCISVNYWYDQEYDGERYVMRQLVSRLTDEVQRSIQTSQTP